MVINFSLVSHAAAALSFLLLAILVGTRYLRRNTDRALLLAALVSAIWAGSLVAQIIWNQPPFFIRYLLELVRDGAWIAVLFALLKDSSRSGTLATKLRRIIGTSSVILIITLLTCGTLEYALGWQLFDGKTKIIGQIALSLLGVCLVEQIWRNSVSFGRSSIKYLCIGIGGLFAYDFFMYSDALLFGQVSDSFWTARGAANAFFAPLFAINMINTRKQPVEFQLSRNAIFHVGALIFAGGYLLFVAAGGYYVRALGGAWGEALQILFLTAFLALFAALLSSTRFRARLMIFISQNFFDYKYDYREEWLKMTQIFANVSEDPPLPERVVRILADLVESNSGALWIKDEDHNFALHTSVNIPPPKYTTIDGESDLVRFFGEKEWIIDLHEYRHDPVRYELLEIPDAVLKFSDGWLTIPLYLGDDLYGICLVGNPYAKVELNWENFDLIRVVARQTCNVLAQADSQNRLSRAMQFEAVSKASAFMVHDLKTMIAQLSLLVKNAQRHRNNPEFIDDMITTTEHAVNKLSNLVDHIRKPATDETPVQSVDLAVIIDDLAKHHARNQPKPKFKPPEEAVTVKGDPEQLRSVLSHLIQNAQDATPPNGDVTLTMKKSVDNVVLFIQDSGTGMSEDFIKMKLFKPFESTKGLAGMGIGAYQAREYVRQIGGNIDVTSELQVGSCFSVRLPLARDDEQNNAGEKPDQNESTISQLTGDA
ncbi:MAG: PEP-CTERM system histidine kinase PrsK [Alteromonadaceae bacterium]|nr:PEP-CTERM system histidine kinase PrsK [Alteromonadaceae bacterium]MBH87350.1 PEP-CTERM system histidine kinase PrsK [Alteromonadaceae bacterium]|tara:strand:+ start:14233 stop:16365 length:2133 start_codon:yes stop_codon:yes gene_type:complete